MPNRKVVYIRCLPGPITTAPVTSMAVDREPHTLSKDRKALERFRIWYIFIGPTAHYIPITYPLHTHKNILHIFT